MQLTNRRQLPLVTESMAGEIVYADLKTPSQLHASSQLHPTRQLNAPQNLRWYQIMLWVTCFGIVILVAVVITLVLQLEAEKGKAVSCPLKSNCSSDNSHSLLRSRICIQSKGNSSVNSPCQICPPHWHLHQDKCYWLSKTLKSWNESRSDCSEKGAQLVEIQVKEELEFLRNITQDSQKFWIGLFSSEKKWRWITGDQIDQNVFQEPPSSAGEESCGRIKSSTITPDICTAVYGWICQKDPILL